MDMVNKMDKIYIDAPLILLGDFNHCSLESVLPAYY